MKLIIDIPDTIGKHIRDSYNIHLSDATLMKVKKAIKNGTPLDDLRAELHATAEMHDDGDYYLRDEWIDEYFDMYRNEVSKE